MAHRANWAGPFLDEGSAFPVTQRAAAVRGGRVDRDHPAAMTEEARVLGPMVQHMAATAVQVGGAHSRRLMAHGAD